jgi:NAD(P)-dependent dehydrogenase (short-subunit alcohol dehydrogenase family)
MKNLAIIIGGSSGIGLAICQELKRDYIVVNMSRRENCISENIMTDVSNSDFVKESFLECVKKYGKPSIMVYCAGFVEPQGIREITEEIWQQTLDVNLTGSFRCTQEFIKICKNNSKIIYIASTAGTRPQAGWSSYSASKAGLINFALTMSEELKSYNIKVYCIASGRCNTELRKKLAPNEDGDKIMQPEEVAEFIKYLIDDGHLLDGQVIQVNGNK